MRSPMKNVNIGRLGGFTLIELLVVVLIIGILASVALPQYFKAVERSRMAEAETLINNIVLAQRRKYMQTNRYAIDFRGLDVAPKGATGSTYYTKGDPQTGANGNGFWITLGGAHGFPDKMVQVYRVVNGSLDSSVQYQYLLMRWYQSDDVSCYGANDAGKELCADFCGTEEPSGGWCCNNATMGACPWPVDH